MPAFVCRALSGMPVEVYGDGSQVSDMVYVSDVARSLVAALVCVQDGPVPGTVEVGPARSVTVRDLAELVVVEAARLTDVTVPIHYLPMRPGEIPGAQVTADTSTLAMIGVDPGSFVGLERGVASTVSWFAAEQGRLWRSPA